MHRPKKKKKNLLKCYKLLQIGKPSNSFAVFPKLLQSQSVDSKVDAFLLIFTPAFQKKFIIVIFFFVSSILVQLKQVKSLMSVYFFCLSTGF